MNGLAEWLEGFWAYTYKFLFVGIPQFILYLFQGPWQLVETRFLPVRKSVCLSVNLLAFARAGGLLLALRSLHFKKL